MRRLTLILSDLYLPAEAAGEVGPTHPIDLPNLDWLLRFASARARIPDWRAWLAHASGRTDLAHAPPAQVAARGLLAHELAAAAWFATPVQFELRTDHIRLRDRGLPRLHDDEIAQLCAQFARDFGSRYQLHAAGARGFFLTGIAATAAPTVDPARVLGCDVKPALGAVSAGRELFQLATELQMWLHTLPLNAARERAGRPRISSLWLWGGETRAAAVFAGEAPGEFAAGTALHGEDLFMAALARELTGAPPRAPPTGFAALAATAGHAVVELTPMTGEPVSSLAALDAAWFAPLRTALQDGSLAALYLIANDRKVRIAARPGWRFWRRRMSWLEHLKA